MRDGDCPYLRLERTARRLHGLTFEYAGPLEVSEAWFCRHPFHGVEVPLGGDRHPVRSICAECKLPGAADAALADGGRGEAPPGSGSGDEQAGGRAIPV